MIVRGRIKKHEEGEPVAYITHDKRKKAKGGPSRKAPSQNKKGRNEISLSHIECFNFHKKGHYARYYPKKRKRPRYNTKRYTNKKRRKDNQRNNRDRRYERRIGEPSSDHEEDHPPQKKSRAPRYEINAINKSEYILIYSLTISSPVDSWDSWLVDSGAIHHLSGYKEVLSILVERETRLNIILGDNSTQPVKGFGSVKFQLNSRELVLLHDVMYVPRLMKNLVSIYILEDKGMRFAFIKIIFFT